MSQHLTLIFHGKGSVLGEEVTPCLWHGKGLVLGEEFPTTVCHGKGSMLGEELCNYVVGLL